MDASSLSTEIGSIKKTLDSSLNTLKNVDFTSQWAGESSDATKKDYDSILDAISKTITSLSSLSDGLKNVGLCQEEDEKMNSLRYKMSKYNVNSTSMSEADAQQYNLLSHEYNECAKTKEQYIIKIDLGLIMDMDGSLNLKKNVFIILGIMEVLKTLWRNIKKKKLMLLSLLQELIGIDMA